MAIDVPIRCRCGRVRGVALGVSPGTGNRVTCYCGDCQAFARFVGLPGVMDTAGGTDIYQLAPARVRFDEGADAIRCVRLSEKGMYRWYTDCCKTPIGNMAAAKLPFIGMIHVFLDVEATGRSRDEVLGESQGYLFGKFALGGVPAGARKASFGTFVRVVRLLVGWWLRGQGKSSLFDATTGKPRLPPKVLSAQERAALGPR